MQIVLVAPEIPQNTGSVARLCAATNSPLHLVRPLGFHLDNKKMKRAGLDYWEHVDLHLHDSLAAFWQTFPKEKCYFVSTKGKHQYTAINFREDDVLVFGSEGQGLPAELIEQNLEQTITIPMTDKVRSLNLSTSVAIILFESLRQLGD